MVPPPECSPLPSQTYIPSSKIIASSRLAAPTLVSHFEDFCDTMRYHLTAPELVFERIVMNLSDSFTTALKLQWEEHSNADQASMLATEKLEVALQEALLANEKLTAEVATLKKNILATAPSEVAAVEAVKVSHAIGGFSTVGIFSCNEIGHENSGTIYFPNQYTMVPGLVVGLRALNISCDRNARLKAYASEIRTDCFKIHLDSWMNTKLYGGDCAWLAIQADDLDFQYGSYSTLEDHYWDAYPIHNTRKITFKRSYLTAPKVVVWLSTIDLGHGNQWRIKSFATDITATGFTIHIDSWSDSRLYSAMASWVAYPSDRPGVASGCFSTQDTRSPVQPQIYNSAFEAFGSVFEKPPKLFLALNALQMDHKKNMTLQVTADNVSATGMTWHLDAWNDSILYSAGASYIALR